MSLEQSVMQSMNVSMVINKTVQELKQQNQGLMNENIQLKDENKNLQLKLSQLNEKAQYANKIKDSYEEAQRKIKELQNQNDEIQRKQIDIVFELNEKTKEIEKLSSLKDKTSQLTEQLNKLKLENSNLREVQIIFSKQTGKGQSKLEILLTWDARIKNIQLQYGLENDQLQIQGYGEKDDKKIIFKDSIKMQKKVKYLESQVVKDNQLILTYDL